MFIPILVISHHGNLTSGHYVALSKNNLDNKWYEFDDDVIKVVEQQDVVTEAGYLLFYQRRASKIASGRHWCLRSPQVQKALDDARNGIVPEEGEIRQVDDPAVRQNQEKAATLARAAVHEFQRTTVGRHNSNPGLVTKRGDAFYSEGDTYRPLKSRSGASTGALLGMR